MKLNYKRTILIGFAFLSISAFWQMYDNIIPLILKNSFELKETMTGMIMGIDNILALFLLPLFGALSDKVNSRFGKRTPFIICGTILAVISLMILPWADNIRNFPIFIVALGVVLLSMALYRSPAVALMPDLTPKPLRSKGNAVINLMGTVGAIYALMMIKVLVGPGETPDYSLLFLSIGALMIVSVVILVLTIRENKLRASIPELVEDETDVSLNHKQQAGKLSPEVRRSLIWILVSIFLWFAAYNAVTSAFSRYATVVWGLESGGYADCLMVATVSAVISYLPIGFISSHIGRKKTIIGGIILMTACYLFAAFFINYHAVINIGFALIGIAWAAINVNSLPMVVEIASNSDIGKYTGYYYTFSMAAQAVTPLLSGVFLEYVSYQTLFPYAFCFSLLALFTMSRVRHGDSKPVKKKKVLEHFDVED